MQCLSLPSRGRTNNQLHVDAWQGSDGGERDESGDDGNTPSEGSSGEASAGGSERVSQRDNPGATIWKHSGYSAMLAACRARRMGFTHAVA